MIYKEFDFIFRNTFFYGQYWQSPFTKAVVLLVHGMGEHSGRYANFVVPKLLENNVSVITYDQYGHGKTQGKKGHNPGFDALLDCVEIMLMQAKDIFNNVPYFLYGHSMGGNVVLNYILRRKNDLIGAIATSPFLRLAFTPPKWQLILGKLLQKIAPATTIPSGLEVKAISRDHMEVQKYLNDPLVHDKISPNYSITMINTGEWLIKNAKKLNKPLLLLHGTGDRLTSFKASQEFYKNSNSNASLKLFEKGYHELHNDICKEEMIETIVQWIKTQLKAKNNS
ncbi:MAG: lysophospholipase [Flavobacteriaceae bacterium]|nr:lysophospholipase [Flavobacteriaceae bacterium]